MSYILTFIAFILVTVTVASGAGLPNKNIDINENLFTGSSVTVKDDETERFEKTYPFNSDGRVQVSNINGSITVEAWDKNEIRFEYTKVASTKQRLTEMEVRINAQQDVFTVDTKYQRIKRSKKTNWKNNKLYANFKITVPRGARLDDIESVNGSVTVSNMTNYSDISAVNGSVKASNLRGTAKLGTVNGTVYADFESLKDSSTISLGTVNGSVKLLIPSNSNATVKADTVNGRISNEFRLPVRKGKYVGRDMYGKIGNGNVKIKLTSVNGGLFVNRKKDGKNLSPSVNLLKTKSNQDDDFDDDFDINISERKRAAKEAQRERKGAQRERMQEQRERLREERNARRERQRELRNERRERAREKAETDVARVFSEAEIEKISAEAKIQAEKALANVKAIKIDSKMIAEQVKLAEVARKAAMENMKDAMYFRRAPFVVEKTDTFKVRPNPMVEIDARNSEIVIKGWDKNEVKYTISKVKQARNVSPVTIRTQHDNSPNEARDKISLRVESSNDRSSRNPRDFNRIRIEVYVPTESGLHIRTNQEIRVEGVKGDLELSGKEGAINVRDSKGKLDVSTTRGMIRVIGFDGEIKSKSYKGMINLEGDLDKFSARNTYGTLVLTLPEAKKAKIQNGDLNLGFVEKDGKLFRSGKSSLSFTF